MRSRRYPDRPLLGVSVAIWRGERILLAQRRRPPRDGLWALPGGLLEAGETLEEGARREMREETGLGLGALHFTSFREIITRDAAGEVEHHYVLAVFAARSDKGEAAAGDDAAAVRWVLPGELADLPLMDGIAAAVAESRKRLRRAD